MNTSPFAISQIRHVPQTEIGIRTLAELIERSHHSGDQATIIACVRSLGRSPEGRHELGLLRISLFGGSPVDRQTGTINFALKASPGSNVHIWERALEGVDIGGAPDLGRSESEAFANLTAEQLVSWDALTIVRYLGYINRIFWSVAHAKDEVLRQQFTDLWFAAIDNLKTAHELALEAPNLRAQYTVGSREITTHAIAQIEGSGNL